MIDEPATDVFYTLLYTLGVSSNLLFLVYLAVKRLPTAIDRLIFALSLAQLVLIITGIPFIYDVAVGEPYKYGDFPCTVINPLSNILDFSEAFLYAMITVFVAEKLRGDHEIKYRVLGFMTLLQTFCIVFLLPTFGVWALVPRSVIQPNREDSEKLICLKTWSRKTNALHHVSQALQFFVPLAVSVKHLVKARKVIKIMVTQMNSKRSDTRYQSFGKIIANEEPIRDSDLCFGESEELHLEMGKLYHKGDIISISPFKDEIDSSKAADMFTNEIEIDQIDSSSLLWRGRPKKGEYQKTTLSTQWFYYAQNLYHVFLISIAIRVVLCLPTPIFRLYTITTSPYEYTDAEQSVAKVIVWLRFFLCAIQPWIFVFLMTKYRVNLFGRCCRPKRNDPKEMFSKSSVEYSKPLLFGS